MGDFTLRDNIGRGPSILLSYLAPTPPPPPPADDSKKPSPRPIYAFYGDLYVKLSLAHLILYAPIVT